MKYIIEDIKLFGYHGVYEEEKLNGQYFYIKLSYSVNDSDVFMNDTIEDVVDYISIKNVIKEVFESNRYNLLETLIKNISVAIKDNFSEVSNIKISISKKIKDGSVISVKHASK